MTDQIREQISALLDGELASGEISLLVRRMERDAELRRAFGSYVLAGESLRAPGGLTASPGFAARVSAALDADGASVPSAPAIDRPAPRRWARPLAAAAVAAGAAAAAILLVPTGDDGNGMLAERGTAPAAMAVAAVPPGGASPTPAQNQRLAGYLMAHGQYASPIGRRNAWSNALAADPGITRVALEIAERP
jgi:sigma-E factor negative regulatory protein RseA